MCGDARALELALRFRGNLARLARPSRPGAGTAAAHWRLEAGRACRRRRSLILSVSPKRRSPGCRRASGVCATASWCGLRISRTTRRCATWAATAPSIFWASSAASGLAQDGASPTTGQFPNMIWLYRRPILDYWAEHEETLGALVTHVLVHEIGHHFGLSDADMEAIEAAADERRAGTA